MKFNPRNIDHVKAYRSFCQTGAWPVENDIDERGTEPFWVMIIQGRMCEAFVENHLGPFEKV